MTNAGPKILLGTVLDAGGEDIFNVMCACSSAIAGDPIQCQLARAPFKSSPVHTNESNLAINNGILLMVQL